MLVVVTAWQLQEGQWGRVQNTADQTGAAQEEKLELQLEEIQEGMLWVPKYLSLL